jgi:Lysyl oxidase
MRWVAVLVVSAVGVALGIAGLLLLRDDGPEELLPDLEQAVPTKLEIVEDGDSYRLVFTSAVVNVGRGPLLIEGSRPNRETPAMSIQQLVRRSDGSARVQPLPGELRYVESENEGRWELLDPALVELRTAADAELVSPGETAGLCLGDSSDADPEAAAEGEPERPVWTVDCGRGEPGLLTVREGLSPGFAAAGSRAGGGSVEVTNVPAGRYVLVQQANPERAVVESDYGNNAASVLIQLRRSGAIPSVRVLARCPGIEVCRPS